MLRVVPGYRVRVLETEEGEVGKEVICMAGKGKKGGGKKC